MRYRVGLLDSEYCFSIALMEYLNCNFSEKLSVVVFKDKEAVDEYMKNNPLHVLLADDCGKESFDTLVLRLRTDKNACDENSIFKYQSARELAVKLLGRIEKRYSAAVKKPMLVGVTSPVGCCGKTRLALGLCAARKDSLYIGIESTPAVECMPVNVNEMEHMKKLSEGFVYYLATENKEILKLIRELPLKSGYRALVILGAGRSFDEITEANISWFKGLIEEGGEYSMVVFDVGDGMLADFGIFSIFDRLYVPVSENEYAAAKLRYYETNYGINRETYKTMRYVSVPEYPYDSKGMQEFIEEGGF